MPRGKPARKTTRKLPQKSNQNFFSKIKLGESYVSLFLGIVVIIIIAAIGASFIRFGGGNGGETSSTSTQEENSSEVAQLPGKYMVEEGDDLWKISEKIYGTGYNWVDIANTNNLENPGVIYTGQELSIPDVKPIVPVVIDEDPVQTEAIEGESYTVREGDNLWEIALRAYGDGYKWAQLSQHNNLENPDLIYPGNTLSIPR